MNKVELIYEGHGKKYIHINEKIFHCVIVINIINGRIVLDSAEKFKENWKYERKKYT